jgi:hypothetical protein
VVVVASVATPDPKDLPGVELEVGRTAGVELEVAAGQEALGIRARARQVLVVVVASGATPVPKDLPGVELGIGHTAGVEHEVAAGHEALDIRVGVRQVPVAAAGQQVPGIQVGVRQVPVVVEVLVGSPVPMDPLGAVPEVGLEVAPADRMGVGPAAVQVVPRIPVAGQRELAEVVVQVGATRPVGPVLRVPGPPV